MLPYLKTLVCWKAGEGIGEGPPEAAGSESEAKSRKYASQHKYDFTILIPTPSIPHNKTYTNIYR